MSHSIIPAAGKCRKMAGSSPLYSEHLDAAFAWTFVIGIFEVYPFMTFDVYGEGSILKLILTRLLRHMEIDDSYVQGALNLQDTCKR